MQKNKNLYTISSLKLFNNKNSFIFKNIKLNEDFKIKEFKSIKAKFYNNDDVLNDISVIKKKYYRIKI